MKELRYELNFATPAFLGNAEQQGQWRTPPIKALLRQWWRVAYAADHSFAVNVADMRREEGLLFGHAWLEDDRDKRGRKTAARKSLVRIRLDRWDGGKLENWQALATVTHPEVQFPVGSDLYMGYGPLILPRGARQPALKTNAAIQSGETATFALAVPDEFVPRVRRALALMDRYGTLGGRGRNGWGSFALIPQRETPALELQPALRDWNAALKEDWPHAIGMDESERPLIWQTAPHEDWKSLMKTLAVVKIALRTQFAFPNAAPPHPRPLPRHWLSYPITRHGTQAFDRNARLPNSLRFKVRPTADGKLVGVIVHVPCKPPAAFKPDVPAITSMWQTVHALLDELTRAASARDYTSITDTTRRGKLEPGLNSVTLKRIPE